VKNRRNLVRFAQKGRKKQITADAIFDCGLVLVFTAPALVALLQKKKAARNHAASSFSETVS
jgi:hypothetical protein